MRGIGKIKFYNDEKGYGFITSGAQDIFFHITDFNQELHGDPNKDLVVTFTLSKSMDRKNNSERMRAREIMPVDDDPIMADIVSEGDDYIPERDIEGGTSKNS